MAGPHEKKLLHTLLDNYNVLERPVVNESDPLQLSFGLTLMQIIDVVSSLDCHLINTSPLRYISPAKAQVEFSFENSQIMSPPSL
uniref:Neurotransmitter-gated ion-channel ligand-binding domain-containing protein n=1 Tax=Lutzomyia longipalpis TaxID=7200 RepID=A0A1B0CQW5_LUTLO